MQYQFLVLPKPLICVPQFIPLWHWVISCPFNRHMASFQGLYETVVKAFLRVRNCFVQFDHWAEEDSLPLFFICTGTETSRSEVSLLAGGALVGSVFTRSIFAPTSLLYHLSWWKMPSYYFLPFCLGGPKEINSHVKQLLLLWQPFHWQIEMWGIWYWFLASVLGRIDCHKLSGVPGCYRVGVGVQSCLDLQNKYAPIKVAFQGKLL